MIADFFYSPGTAVQCILLCNVNLELLITFLMLPKEFDVL